MCAPSIPPPPMAQLRPLSKTQRPERRDPVGQFVLPNWATMHEPMAQQYVNVLTEWIKTLH
ncbi:hypothetical protein GCM10010289_85170 [Streptomyces violascens]|nr:hypothetical protein GCM10010289_85170 [Streptomyces violascens]